MAATDDLEAIFRRDVEVAGRAWGPFALRRALGRGAAAVVLEAEHVEKKLPVALKVLRPQVAAEQNELARFLQEVALAVEAEHPNIVGIVDSGQVEHLHYYAMELVAGRDLLGLVAAHGRPPIEWAVPTLAAVASAVARLHALGVIHRDLKPANVLVEAGTNRPVLTDLGIAKQLEPGKAAPRGDSRRLPSEALRALVGAPHTAKRQILGTPAYMAPEQVDGKAGPASPLTDVYGFGAICYHLLAGVPPFEGKDVVSLLEAVCEQPPLPLREVRASIPRDLDALVGKCLKKAPAERPRAMTEVLAALAALSARLGEPTAGPYGRPWGRAGAPGVAPLSDTGPVTPRCGPWELEDALGEDPTGTLHLATGPGGTRALVKVAPPGGEDALGLEAEALRRFGHAAFARPLESSRAPGHAFIAFAPPPGAPLHERMTGDQAPRRGDAVALVRALAQALADAEAKGLVHPDLGPSRVWLAEDGAPVVLGLVPAAAARGWPDHRPAPRALLELLFELVTGRRPGRGAEAAVAEAWPDAPPQAVRLLALAGEQASLPLAELVGLLDAAAQPARQAKGFTNKLKKWFGGG